MLPARRATGTNIDIDKSTTDDCQKVNSVYSHYFRQAARDDEILPIRARRFPVGMTAHQISVQEVSKLDDNDDKVRRVSSNQYHATIGLHARGHFATTRDIRRFTIYQARECNIPRATDNRRSFDSIRYNNRPDFVSVADACYYIVYEMQQLHRRTNGNFRGPWATSITSARWP